MKNRIKTAMIAAVSVLTLGAFTPNADAGGCSTSRVTIGYGHRNGYSNGYSNHHQSRNSYRGTSRSSVHFGVNYSQPSYRDTCSQIDTCYFTRGCYRYAKYTYLHRRIDCHGRVVRCWKTYKTVCLGRYH